MGLLHKIDYNASCCAGIRTPKSVTLSAVDSFACQTIHYGELTQNMTSVISTYLVRAPGLAFLLNYGIPLTQNAKRQLKLCCVTVRIVID